MDMEILQEYTENQYYLRAISSINYEHLEFDILNVPDDIINKNKHLETLENILIQPIGNFLFRYHLYNINAVEYLLFLNEIENYEGFYLAPITYKKMMACKIYDAYINNPILNLKIPSYIKKNLKFIFDNIESPEFEFPNDDIFLSAKMAAFRILSLSCFPSFLESNYYSRLLGFRKAAAAPITKGSFDFIRVLGEGGFGKVFAVMKKDTKGMYACKALNKSKIIAKKREKLIHNERNVLVEIQSEFIITLKYAFQDEQTLYLVTDLMTGGDMQFHLNRFGVFNESWVQFYAAGIVLGIEYLHSKGIVFRDLKPDNLLLDETGFIRLTDLGLASFIGPDEYLHQHCGTRSYMAPEQTYGEAGYQKEVDYWSLGVLMYLMLTGTNPFSKRSKTAPVAKLKTPLLKPLVSNPGLVECDENKIDETKKVVVEEIKAPSGKYESKTDYKGIKELKLNVDIPDAARIEPRTRKSSVLTLETPKSFASLQPFPFSSPKARSERLGSAISLHMRRGSEMNVSINNTRQSLNVIVDETLPAAESRDAKIKRYAELDDKFRALVINMEYPDIISVPAQSLIKRLIVLDPKQRLGHNGVDEIKNHPFFANLNWDKMKRKHISPPFVPSQHHVNAEYLEAAYVGLAQSTKKSKDTETKNFENFDYVDPLTFQFEIIDTVHDKNKLANGN